MSYLGNCSHFRNWIFSETELVLIQKLREEKVVFFFSEVLRNCAEETDRIPAIQTAPRSCRSFAALVSARTNSERDDSDGNDTIVLSSIDSSSSPLPVELLSGEEELGVRNHYEKLILDSCNQLFRTSEKLKSCAVMLFKRFYLSNSVMEFHPKFIVPTVIYLAGKIEEQFINVDTIAEKLKIDHKQVIGHEMVVMEGVRFQLIMYHPFRALVGFIEDARKYCRTQKKELKVDALQKLHANACSLLNTLLLTNIPLLFNPSYLALAALRHAINDYEKQNNTALFNVEEYIETKAEGKAKVLQEINKSLDRIDQLMEEDAEQAKAQNPLVIKAGYKKLKAFFKTSKVEESKDDKKKKKKKGEKKEKKKRKRDKISNTPVS